MISKAFELVRFDADEGKVFDFKEPRFEKDEDGNEVQIHLNAKTLYFGSNNSIENYVEVDADGNITELTAEVATETDFINALNELGVE